MSPLYDDDQLSDVPWPFRLRTIHTAILAGAALSIVAALQWPRGWRVIVVGDLAMASMLFGVAACRAWFLFGSRPRRPVPRRLALAGRGLAPLLLLAASLAWAQPPFDGPTGPFPGAQGGPPRFGPGMRSKRKLLAKYDENHDGWLNREERSAARESLKAERESRPAGDRRRPFGGPPGFGPPGSPPPGFGPPGFRGHEDQEPAKPGIHVSPDDVASQPDKPLYDAAVLRTLFLDFEDDDWEKELVEFHGSDIELPATLTVDGRKYANVGVHFRGMSSYGMVPAGRKRSLNVSLDVVNKDQRLYGYKTLNLLNSHEDPTFLHTVLYSHVARRYIPAPKANFVRVVINGESWGLYVNAQQFDKVFLEENYQSAKGARWKVPGSPGGRGGLNYLGDEIDDYKRIYEMKSGHGDKAWKDLIALCKSLSQTPLDKLEEALRPILDIDGALWFLALENALINSDGYWVRASDYSLFRDERGKFHVIPHDVNETFQAAMGPGMGPPRGFRPRGDRPPRRETEAAPGEQPGGGRDRREPRPDDSNPQAPREESGDERRQPRPNDAGPRRGPPPGNGLELDPLVGMNDPNKPLRSRLLAVPALRERYLEHVRTIAADWLDWSQLGPVVQSYVTLIEGEVEADTRKLSSTAAFRAATGDAAENTENAEADRRGRVSLKSFAGKRRDYLLKHAAEDEASAERRVDEK